MLRSNKFIKSICAAAIAAVVSHAAISPAHAVEVQRVISPDGIEAWLVEDHTVPIIAVNFAFEGGAAQDPEGKAGLTRLLAATMDEGAGDLDSEAFQSRLEDLAVSISFNTNKDRFFGSMRTLTPTLDEASGLLALALTDPRFDAAPVERMKTSLITSAKRNETDPNGIAGRALSDAMFAGHVYNRPTGGTPESLADLSAEDLRAQHAKIISRSSVTIGVVGAITADQLSAMLDEVFSPLPETSDLQPVEDFVPSTGASISKELDIPQTTVLVGLPGLKRDDPDYQAAFVMNHILGGGTFTSWMFREVREKRGLSYGASTYLSPYQHTGLLIGSAATRADRADETVTVMLEQLTRMATDGPSEDELQAAKQFLTGSYPLRFDSSGKIARQLVALQTTGLGIDYFDRRNAEIEAVTLEDVQRVARRLLQDVEPTVIRVGPVQG